VGIRSSRLGAVSRQVKSASTVTSSKTTVVLSDPRMGFDRPGVPYLDLCPFHSGASWEHLCRVIVDADLLT
jgi:hypothetical protein